MRSYITTGGLRISVPCGSPLDEYAPFEKRFKTEVKELRTSKKTTERAVGIIPLIPKGKKFLTELSQATAYHRLAQQMWMMEPLDNWGHVEVLRTFFATLPADADRGAVLNDLWQVLVRVGMGLGLMDANGRPLYNGKPLKPKKQFYPISLPLRLPRTGRRTGWIGERRRKRA